MYMKPRQQWYKHTNLGFFLIISRKSRGVQHSPAHGLRASVFWAPLTPLSPSRSAFVLMLSWFLPLALGKKKTEKRVEMQTKPVGLSASSPRHGLLTAYCLGLHPPLVTKAVAFCLYKQNWFLVERKKNIET